MSPNAILLSFKFLSVILFSVILHNVVALNKLLRQFKVKKVFLKWENKMNLKRTNF
jgi:hypothetical protein